MGMMIRKGMAVSQEDRDLGLWIRQRRLERGLTQHVLAERAGLSRRWLVDVENGHLQPKFADLLRLLDVLDADLMEVPGVRRSRTAPVGRTLSDEEGAEVKRREFLGWIVAAASAATVVDIDRLASPKVDAAWLVDAESVSVGLAKQRDAVEAAVLLPAVLGHLASLESMLPASAELTARTALLAGDLLLGYRRPIGVQTRQRLGEAYRCFVLAESLGSPAIATKAMVSRAALYDQRGDLSLAFALQDEAVNRRMGARTTLPWLLARRAELHARRGSDAAAMRDLDSAERAMSGPEEWWSMSPPRGAVELAAYRGTTLSSLGRYREAADTLTWVLERMDPSKVMWRAAVAVDRDAAVAQL